MANNAMPQPQLLLLLLLLLLQLLLVTFVLVVDAKSNVTSIIVFGDSSVDTGNNNQIVTIAKSDFEPYGRDFPGGRPTGRFSNGRVATDLISEAFGIKPIIPAYLDPAYNITDFVDGVCFASAATGYDNATSQVLNVIPLWKQVEYFKDYQKKLKRYLGAKKAHWMLKEALYMVSLGTNDFLENYYATSRRSSQYNIEEYQDFLISIAESFAREMYNLGARKMSMGGLAPMGCMPLERTVYDMDRGGCVEQYNMVAMEFNGKLEAMVARLRAQLKGFRLVYSNVYDTVLQAIENPSTYGFENVADGCCGTGMYEMGYLCDKYNPFTCKDASKYIFWDSFHPTERTDQIVAEHVMKTSLAEFV
ncbi:GDSL esterase/lipase [Cinnamomum micranthum f. kanehirae]|uniref:GDSL esterase/lipase n=1 Tax=Cinnamomum micranthum f. kanehirae TaxID=337451 RepID=A0A443MZZ5_9MAGN|nr:GDSL esterase/lipase [Cinnamomum micranthum f. kanehirae]